MPLYLPNTRFSDCWSSMGNITFYHKNGKCYWRKKSTLKFVGTPAQLSALEVHRRALKAWRGLTHEQQLQWNDVARGVKSRRMPISNVSHISGYNLFISAYHGFCTLGNEHVPQIQKFVPVPEFQLEFISAQRAGNLGLCLKFRLCVLGNDPMRYALLGKIQLQTAGMGCNPGKMKNVLADDGQIYDGQSREIEFNIIDYRKFCGLDLNNYSLHLRAMLIDRETGYRGYIKTKSQRISLVV